MRWQTTDIDTYQQSQSYVDTALIPLLPVSLGEEMKMKVAMGEYISLIAMEMEKQFRGRMMQLPPLSYPQNEGVEELLQHLNAWVEELKANGKNHIIWLTSDPMWKKYEDEIPGGLLLWLPHLPIEHLDPQLRQKTINDQMKEILPTIMKEWRQDKGS
ncbi:hypothetical protein HNR44_000999 [Geomicrobium halophilum]|uniref:DUF2487 family protein n=1 Tax=Geomicrobium halophilum TaxID=549000 RepID=A0A841PJU3_9BACL|nr:YpiF family protein [Geomicrobium halophilum]MBB6449050.1 hypothetical protein [Geomicrobium halophilum]